MWQDPIVEDIRKIREEHAAQFNYDPIAIYKDLKRLEEDSGRKMVSLQSKPFQKRTGHPKCS